jgi:NADH-quinone oxidoreductase subunit E
MKQTDSRSTTARLRHILSRHKPERVELIRILQEAEDEFGYLPREAMLEAANFTQIPAASVYGTATFYNRFRFTPLGRHPVKACMGTACHMVGGALVLDALERELDIKVGGITHDGEFSLDRVACIGCCFLAPVVTVGENIHPRMTPFKVEEVLAGLKEREPRETPHDA